MGVDRLNGRCLTVGMTNETETKTTGPRIYVASLTDYNAGVLHGEWIDAHASPDEIRQEIATMLATSPTAEVEGSPAEEWAIHDYEGFDGIRLDGREDIDAISDIAYALVDHYEPEALGAFLANESDGSLSNAADLLGDFDDAYAGCWASVEDYAYELADDVYGLSRRSDDVLAQYFDVKAFARDLEMGGDIWTAPASGGDVYVFRAF